MLKFVLLILIIFLTACGGGGGGTPNNDNKDPVVILEWDKVSEEDIITGYKLYIGPEAGKYETIIDVGNTNEKLVEFEKDSVYHIAVTAYYKNIIDDVIEESDYSDEVIIQTK